MRGIKEELGLDVEKLESTGTFRFKKRGQLMHGFIASVKSRNLSVPGRLNRFMGPRCEGTRNHVRGLEWEPRLGHLQNLYERKRHSDMNIMKSGGWNDVEKISC